MWRRNGRFPSPREPTPRFCRWSSTILRIELWLWPGAEDRSTDANARGTLFHRNFEIVGHAHGQLAHGDIGKRASGDAVAEFAKFSEMRPRVFRILSDGGHSHQAADLEITEAWRR